MSGYLFDFLIDVNPKLAGLANKVEDMVYEYPNSAIMNARLFTEELAKQIIRQEDDLSYLLHKRQAERIHGLDNNGILKKDVSKAFDTVRSIGNKSVHNIQDENIEDALRVHRNMFKLSVWYMEVYGDYSFASPEYRSPKIPTKAEETANSINKDEINDFIKDTLTQQLQDLIKEKNVTSLDDNIGPLDNQKKEEKINPQKLGGSALIYELSKLRESSQEAIENANAFSEFKEYMHVERPIQEDLVNALESASKKSGSQLVLLCGSVGDGKSHMLAYLKKNRPDIMEQFAIHNDATESFDPTKDSMDTLNEILEPFSDTNIERSNENLILAINLGVLHNFLETEYAKSSYQKLSNYIFASNVFDRTILTDQTESNSFQLISFSDYHAYELTINGPESSYFHELLKRIALPVEQNPFYQAFLFDASSGYKGTAMLNYKLLQSESVRERIVDILIATIIQRKVIISTRALMNFIYDILVPNDYERGHYPSLIESMESLLPNLIFGHPEKSQILQKIAFLDPVDTRSEKLDQAIIELNNAHNIKEVFKKNIKLHQLDQIREGLEELGPFFELTQSTKSLLNSSLIRLIYFLSDQLHDEFKKTLYKEYGQYLYEYNQGNARGLRNLYQKVIEAVFKWRGSPKQNYIYTTDSGDDMKLAIELDMSPDVSNLIKRDKDVHYRFNNTLIVDYMCNSNSVKLELDYPLFERVMNVLNGYRPNKKDKEDAIQFVEFIEKIVSLNSNVNNMIIYQMNSKKLFNFSFDPIFEEYTFKRY
ncbi:DNA phosphorothioation-dependent restriction protein DptF [Pontibacillus litoralis]|uniref:DNA phosphorothioation-dependent restriction protein DptF n=1 Tax=Pontibacillus litoralis JSM 072002 TaxID=1385512 RepID=A0A0A5G4R3_9BACI|nr:DNA phosphorothioation-dependent restriction protein DptF [Pontibacillus litoralis]KGX87014.1 DNA phosphorothioation-dependent restriction protein DptF [Pontibacillus litoralis JSM 072002]